MANISVLHEKNTVHHDDERNPGTRLDLGPVKDVRINRSAIERRAATLGTTAVLAFLEAVLAGGAQRVFGRGLAVRRSDRGRTVPHQPCRARAGRAMARRGGR